MWDTSHPEVNAVNGLKRDSVARVLETTERWRITSPDYQSARPRFFRPWIEYEMSNRFHLESGARRLALLCGHLGSLFMVGHGWSM